MDAARRIVLLRGVNVGGANRLTMADLRALLGEIGCGDVRTYLQSGNAVVDAPPVGARSTLEDVDALASRIAGALKERAGLDVAVRVLEADDLRRAAAANPFPTAEDAPTRLHLFFLAAVPEPGASERLADVAAANEAFELRGDVLYLHAPDGIGRSKLAASVERRLGVSATARNWRTVASLLELADRDR